MTTNSPPSPALVAGRKRSRSHGRSPPDSALPRSPSTATAHQPHHHSSHSAASSFRNVSACNRCRLRKNRCDQRLPSCAACEKAQVQCVGFDPITKREIPRSYVYFLENRVSYLESLLRANAIAFTPAEDFTHTPHVKKSTEPVNPNGVPQKPGGAPAPAATGAGDNDQQEREKVDNLLSHMSTVAVQGTSDSRFLGSTSGISFARVVFAAVKSSVSGAPSERGGIRPSKPLASGTTGTSMRDSFFGLHTKPSIKPAPFPNKELGRKLVDLYFEHANPQIPVLHRPEFMAMFDRVYSSEEHTRTARESYMLNIVLAIGAGIIVGKEPESRHRHTSPGDHGETPHHQKKRKLADEQRQPEEYHASAIVHLENFLSSSSAIDRPFEFSGALEELQAVLLLAGFALLRPVAPGLWYIIGVADRLAIDLGLHQEDSADVEADEAREANGDADTKPDPDSIPVISERGRRQYIRDYRRRLWWCVYSFDRLVSTCVGRPFGINDEAVTTSFPSRLDDRFITPAGIPKESSVPVKPTYKLVAYHYFRLRLLQSEILQVLQHRQTQMARERGLNLDNPYMLTHLASPFLKDFDGSFRLWRQDIDRRLWEWKESAPHSRDIGVRFKPLFFELNYWQAVITLYRQSLSPPPALAEELRSTNEDVHSPSMVDVEEPEDEDAVFLKIAEAGQKVLKIYRQLHRMYLVNYTFLATHHLFMAGISFLYAIWHSPVVRSRLTLDDVDFTILAATSVLDDLIEKCPPAEACRDAFQRMSKATIKMCLQTTGFGDQVTFHHTQPPHRSPPNQPFNKSPSVSGPMDMALDPSLASGYEQNRAALRQNRKRPAPRFDLDMRGLFSDEESASRPFSRLNLMPQQPFPPVSQMQQPPASSAPYQPMPVKRESSNPSFPSPPMRASMPTSSSPNMAFTSPAQSQPQQQQQIPNTAPYTLSNTAPYSSLAATIQNQYPMMSPFSDLDFLDTLPIGGPEGSGPGGTSAAGGSQGIVAGAILGNDWDLGLGMGWDGSLPVGGWGDAGDGGGGSVDLFEGFFFGNGGTGTNMNMHM